MKGILTIILAVAVCNLVIGQSVKTSKALKEIEGQYEVDDNGNVTYVKIIEIPNLTKDVLYTRAVDYFTYKYNNGESVIQVNDKENGHIVGKGLYQHTGQYFGYPASYDVDTWHILTVDVKDGKARVILSLTEYRVKTIYSDGDTRYDEGFVSKCYPLDPNGKLKNVYGRSFTGSHERAMATFTELEKNLKEGLTFKGLDKKDW